mmetsp:Transcript_68630/g.108266  ORF Transcript_68630/g.108266 Transcript_68630/m.108266 type:complete len:228 (+) Transcript_68630:68-751(+)
MPRWTLAQCICVTFWLSLDGARPTSDSTGSSSPGNRPAEGVAKSNSIVALGSGSALHLTGSEFPNISLQVGSPISLAQTLSNGGPIHLSGRLTDTRVTHQSNFYDQRKLHTAYQHNFGNTDLGEFALAPPAKGGHFLEDVHNLEEELDPEHGQVSKLHQEDLNAAVMAQIAAANWLNAAEHQRTEGAKEWHEKLDDSIGDIKKDRKRIEAFVKNKVKDATDAFDAEE